MAGFEGDIIIQETVETVIQFIAQDPDEIVVATEYIQGPRGATGAQGPAGATGAQGPAGPATPITQITVAAGENLSAYRIVYINPTDGKAYAATNTDTANSPNIVGMTIAAAVQDADVTIQTGGLLTNNGWNWNPASGKNLYLGTSGQITQTPPSSGVSLKVGFVAVTTKIFLAFGELILLV